MEKLTKGTAPTKNSLGGWVGKGQVSNGGRNKNNDCH